MSSKQVTSSIERYIAGVVDDALELFHRLHELYHHLVIEFLRSDTPTAKSGEIGLLAHTLLCGLCQEQIASVGEIRTLVEMTLKTSVKE